MRKLVLSLSILCAVLFVATIVVMILGAVGIIPGANLTNMITCGFGAIAFAFNTVTFYMLSRNY